ncbi:hypothetical protein [Thiospirillum jenense]|uniref:DUF1640 domain-containing protein n=1 Tax=Thiospirillum jenense TaxID=1653858 RepID=A0A839HE91_9GAMM|nr:hypothetical protein [Thiospirillum jenense]MBB1127193.1 hypothetical protein [Thiospirillum jenense]
MALAQEDIAFIKQYIGEWLAEQSLGKPPLVYEIELRERMVRVEEELKHQRELMLLLQQQMREGFERVDQRFEAMQINMDKRFEAMQNSMDKRFEDVNKRFEQVDKRFEQMDKRFDEMLKRHDQQFLWLFGMIATGVGLIIAALRYL